MTLRCEVFGIRFIEPARSTRLENPQSESDKKYKEAITELNQLKNLQPQIDVAIHENSEAADRRPMVVSLMSPPPATTTIAEEVAAEGRRLALPAPPEQLSSSLKINDLRLVTASFLGEGISVADRSRYNEELAAYLKKFEEWLSKEREADDAGDREFSFHVTVRNSGTTVGTDVDVYLDFPPVLQFMVGDDNRMRGVQVAVPEKPEPPEKPRPRSMIPTPSFRDLLQRSAMPAPYDYLRGYREPSLANHPETPWSSLSGDADTGFQLRLFFPKLNHHKGRTFGPFHTGFTSWDDAKTFPIQLSVMAGNMPKKIEGQLPVIVRVGQLPSNKQ